MTSITTVDNSLCRYPVCSACLTLSSPSFPLARYTPRPSLGKYLPLVSLTAESSDKDIFKKVNVGDCMV